MIAEFTTIDGNPIGIVARNVAAFYPHKDWTMIAFSAVSDDEVLAFAVKETFATVARKLGASLQEGK
jgi:hypothetical protein